MTKAEKAARRVASLVPEGSDRYTAEVTTSRQEAVLYSSGKIMVPAMEYAVVTLRDSLTGGQVWMQWRTTTGPMPEGRRAATAFVSGGYQWSYTSPQRKITSARKAYLGVLPTFIS